MKGQYNRQPQLRVKPIHYFNEPIHEEAKVICRKRYGETALVTNNVLEVSCPGCLGALAELKR